MLVRREGLSETMSRYLIQRITDNPGIEVHYKTEITALDGDMQLKQVTWRDNASGETSTHDIHHVFIMAGASPRTDWLEGCVALDDKGFILTGRDLNGHAANGSTKTWSLNRVPQMLATSLAKVFAVREVRSGKASAQSRQDRLNKPPTWKGAFYRALAAAVLMVAILLLLNHKDPGVAFVGFPIALLIYLPVSYYTDNWAYKRRLAKAAAAAIEDVYRLGGFAPPAREDVLARAPYRGAAERMYQALLDAGVLVDVGGDVVFHRDALAEIEARVVSHITAHGDITVAALQDQLGSSRKFTLSVLEYFDTRHLTRRIGDKRILVRPPARS